MALKPEEDMLLTSVGGNTPMGQLLRQYWVPAIRSEALALDGAPQRITLFGDRFVMFRSADGVGILDEACPHRGVSMALARNEQNGLRCIFHGWKFDVSGNLVDAPCEPEALRAKFIRTIRVKNYHTREVAGVVWVFVGGGTPPPFPDFQFNSLPPSRVVIRRAVVPYNWVQGVEAHIDSSHVPFLHRGFLTKNRDRLDKGTAANLGAMMQDESPRLEMEETPYGLREAALRTMSDGQTYARIREIVLPFFTFIPGAEIGPFGARVSVPIDELTSAEWYIVYNPLRDLSEADIASSFGGSSDDPDNFAANLGTAENLWGQDRAAMKDGHFSGLTKSVPFEDFIVQASMGSRVDRSLEQLGSGDAIVVRARRLLIEAARAYAGGDKAKWTTGFSYESIQARSATFPADRNWKDFSSEPKPNPAATGASVDA